MEISEKPTLIEKSDTMYSANNPNVVTWIDWIHYFVDKCKELGWEVAPGPGTSLGSVFPERYVNNSDWTITGGFACNYDCDWTQENGIPIQWQNTTFDNVQNGYPLYKGWFYGMTTWSSIKYPTGIDEEHGRFDIIVYLAENNLQEKIGIRIKYPVCSVGHNEPHQSRIGNFYYSGVNCLYTVPVFSIYSNLKENLGFSTTDLGSNITSMSRIFNGYFTLFSKEEQGYYTTSNTKMLFKAGLKLVDNVLTDYQPSNISEKDNNDSYLWSLDLQKTDDFYYSYNRGYPNEAIVSQRVFKNNWKNYNKFNYHYSASGDTLYFYISTQDNKVGIKFIVTTLENNEKVIIIERSMITEEKTLCDCIGYTENYYTIPTQDKSNQLIIIPQRPYTKISSEIGQFSLSRALLPGQKVLCKDLYFVTKRDNNEIIDNGAYILVKDKKGKDHYFRVIPFGSSKTYEVSGDNTTYLAFPVADPKETGD